MNSFEQAPQASSESGRARVKPLSERARRPRFVDPEMEEEQMPDTRRTGRAPEQPKKPTEKPVEGTERIERVQEQIKTPEQSPEIQKLDSYLTQSLNRAQGVLLDLRGAEQHRKLDATLFEESRQKVLIDLNYLFDLQRYTLQLTKSPEASKLQEKVFDAIQFIQNGIHDVEQTLRSQEVAQRWGTGTPWASEERAKVQRADVDPETAALANKFASSAKKMESQKKSVWGRIKGWFS